MEKLIEGLTALIKRGGKRGDAPSDVRVDTSGAPACVRALVDEMASGSYAVDLGEFHLRPSHRIESLAASIEAGQTGAELDDLDGYLASRGPGGASVDPASTIQLAADRGGMSALGLGWADGRVYAAIVEIEDSGEENLVRTFVTPADFFSRLDQINRDRVGADVEALRVAAGLATAAPPAAEPAAVAPAPVLAAWPGPAPAHPFAEAQAHFGRPAMVFQAGPTPEGRLVLVRRVAHGAQAGPTQIVARTADGATTVLEWDGAVDVNGTCAVPGRERVLVCAGRPGPLVELDLASSARRELLASVGWSCGFVDADHLAVLEGGAVRVYRYGDGALGEPVASLAAPVANIFVGHGRVFGKSSQVGTFAFHVLSWTGGALVDTGAHAVDGKPFALHAASSQDGTLLVGAVDTKGVVSWFAFTPA